MRGAGVSLAAASGYFARCDGRVFRALRGATGGAAPWTPRFGLPAARWIWVARRPLASTTDTRVVDSPHKKKIE